MVFKQTPFAQSKKELPFRTYFFYQNMNFIEHMFA
ncbi:hypothetical protein NEOC65_002190 [Neochlamydia sp. AcF65]|nr:hypothetical protein [Neochlamydia sp. AcF65]MBS4170772.1 hypothetical protein [Neochlamydia sp. AcF95]